MRESVSAKLRPLVSLPASSGDVLMRTVVFRWLVLLAALTLSAPVEHSSALQASKRQKSGPSGPPKPGGIEVDLSPFAIQPRTEDFGAVASGAEQSRALTLKNTGFEPLVLTRLQFLPGASGNSSAFRVVLAGKSYAGGAGDVTRSIVFDRF